MGDEPIKIEQFFYGFEGLIMGSIMGSQNIMGSDYGSNISVFIFFQLQKPFSFSELHFCYKMLGGKGKSIIFLSIVQDCVNHIWRRDPVRTTLRLTMGTNDVPRT
jgi:hypothetical protein